MMRPDIIKAQIAALIDAYPELRDDPILRHDTIEGETDYLAVIDRLVKAIKAREGYASSDRAVAAEFQDVARRHDAAADRMRETIIALMDEASSTKERLPSGGTVNISITKPAPKIADPAQVPAELCKLEPSLTAIRQSIADTGVTPPGAVMSNGRPSLRITK